MFGAEDMRVLQWDLPPAASDRVTGMVPKSDVMQYSLERDVSQILLELMLGTCPSSCERRVEKAVTWPGRRIAEPYWIVLVAHTSRNDQLRSCTHAQLRVTNSTSLIFVSTSLGLSQYSVRVQQHMTTR